MGFPRVWGEKGLEARGGHGKEDGTPNISSSESYLHAM